MNKEQYMKLVMKKLGCTKKEKEKIKVDLNNDIDMALKNGETFEDIMKRMGTPEEVAQEFNDNLGVVYKKSHKKLIIGIIVGIVAVIIAIVLYIQSLIPDIDPLGTSGLYQESEVHQWNVEAIGYLNQNDYDSLRQMTSPHLRDQLDDQIIIKAKNDLGELGHFEKITSEQSAEAKQKGELLVVSEVVALYEKRSVTYTISFNESGQLVGIYMK
ncbi:MAG: DUF3887 domain-containing protein [Longibaculum sp.]